jgi:predicted house-cleaning NTP pyrophosphatase (Maf/HAM1 superfamily)
MLTRLRGRTHQVFTGVAVLRASPNQKETLLSQVVITDVPMRNYSEEEMRRYIRSGDPMDKAGAYGIQNPNFQPVADMQGCYASVMGLPLCALSVLLRQAGVTPRASVAGACQSHLRYACPVSQTYLHSTN